MLAGEGLHPSSKGTWVRFEGASRQVIDGQSEIEIRQIFEGEDFGAEFTQELRVQEERLRAEIVSKS